MELSEVIKKRRSIRHYLKKKIPDDILKDLLEHAILSPSAHNRQPWHYIIINNQDKKERIASILKESTNEETSLSCEVIKECSTLILVFGNIENPEMDLTSIGASIENLILRATDLGVSSLWIGYIRFIEEKLQKEFNRDDTLVSAVALGYSDRTPSPRPRKSLKSVTEWL